MHDFSKCSQTKKSFSVIQPELRSRSRLWGSLSRLMIYVSKYIESYVSSDCSNLSYRMHGSIISLFFIERVCIN